jgi:amidase
LYLVARSFIRSRCIDIFENQFMNPIYYQNAVDLVKAIKDKKMSATEVMRAHIEHIEQYNPSINAIVAMDVDGAMDAAKAADTKLASGAQLGPLFGLPVVHKDTFLTKGMRTTFGSAAYKDNIPTQDSAVVATQKAAGAITLGKSNMPEFGAGSHTFNDVYGATKNPYRHDVSAGGSSGGAAAALAAGFVPLADGSDMGGSLRNPASFCNVVGLRPSIGRVPMVPSTFSFNTLGVAGPMARNVPDLALLFSVLAGVDSRDPLSISAEGQISATLRTINPKGVRVAYSPSIGGLPFDAAIPPIISKGVQCLENMGCQVDEAEPDFSGADYAFEVLRAIAFATNFSPIREAKGDLLKETVRWNIDLGLAMPGESVAKAERYQAVMYQRMEQFLQKYDFLVCPTTQVLPFDIHQEYPKTINGTSMQTYIEWMRSAYRITITGHPAISVPCGFTDDGLPVGMQIVGRYRQEQALMEFAHQFELANPVGMIKPNL